MRELIVVSSHDAPIGGPAGELGAIRKLKLSQHRAHVRFDRLDRNEQFGRHLFICVTTRDQPHDLLLAGGQPVQLLIMSPCRTISAAIRPRRRHTLEGRKYKTGQFWREHGIALMHLLDG